VRGRGIGRLQLNNCILQPYSCKCVEWCPMHQVWEEMRGKFLELLQSRTLDDAVRRNDLITAVEQAVLAK